MGELFSSEAPGAVKSMITGNRAVHERRDFESFQTERFWGFKSFSEIVRNCEEGVAAMESVFLEDNENRKRRKIWKVYKRQESLNKMI
jgi:hypothetical protein